MLSKGYVIFEELYSNFKNILANPKKINISGMSFQKYLVFLDFKSKNNES
jgi:hypothetical protein